MTIPTSSTPIGIVIVTHGNLGAELLKVLEHVVGHQEKIEVVSIGPEDDMEETRLNILKSVNDVNCGKGVIVLTDMFGGTPSNLAISIMESSKIDVIAGINLPMLVKLTSVRSTLTFTEAVDQAKEAGQKYIMTASQILGQEK
ncbi:MAG: PTS fructose transporter subunit IIA [Rhodospirillaceae bacterium]|nr:PTS fructose transporter subunit IIA [Rhodospirillaceae bacterium]